MPLFNDILPLVAAYGYWVVAATIAVESFGVPLPGETTLVVAALYAGKTHHLDIWLVIVAASIGTVIGGCMGFWLGRSIGFPLALRHGARIGMTEARLKLGQYLFLTHGGKVVFFGRFVALLRVLAAFLAGVNHMSFRKFFIYNATGGIVWVLFFGGGAYLLGKQVHQLFSTTGLVAMIVVGALVIKGFLFLRKHEAELQRKADIALPGPLNPSPGSSPAPSTQPEP